MVVAATVVVEDPVVEATAMAVGIATVAGAAGVTDGVMADADGATAGAAMEDAVVVVDYTKADA